MLASASERLPCPGEPWWGTAWCHQNPQKAKTTGDWSSRALGHLDYRKEGSMSSSEVEGFESSLNCADWHVHCEQICFPFCSNFGYIRFVFVNIFITAFSILVRIDYEQSAVILTIQSSSCVEPALNQPSDRLVSTHSLGGCANRLVSTCSRSAYEKGDVLSMRSPGDCTNRLVSVRFLWRLPEGACVCTSPWWTPPHPPEGQHS